MKIVISPDKFKGSLSANEAARAIAEGILNTNPEAEVIILPVADGGEGMLDVMLSALGGVKQKAKVLGPAKDLVCAEYGILSDGTAIIEMAQASGISLIPKEKQDPLETTTFGTGELILAALDAGCRNFIIGVGGSATCDAGTGMAQALGVRFLNSKGKEIGFGGKNLRLIDKVDINRIDKRIYQSAFIVAADVDNPLFGPDGAAHVFAPQKGADKNAVNILDKGLRQFSLVVKDELGIDLSIIPGAGAAGGLAAGLMAFCKAEIKTGAEVVLNALRFDEKIKGADLVITGEGQLDGQSIHGKAPISVAMHAKKLGIKCIAIVGSLGQEYDKALKYGISKIVSLEEIANSKEFAIKDAKTYLKKASAEIAKQF